MGSRNGLYDPFYLPVVNIEPSDFVGTNYGTNFGSNNAFWPNFDNNNYSYTPIIPLEPVYPTSTASYFPSGTNYGGTMSSGSGTSGTGTNGISTSFLRDPRLPINRLDNMNGGTMTAGNQELGPSTSGASTSAAGTSGSSTSTTQMPATAGPSKIKPKKEKIRLRLADNGPSLIFRDPADAPSTSRTSTTAPNSSNPSSSTSDPTSFEAISQKINSMRLRLADNGPSLVWNGRNVPQASNPGSSNSQRTTSNQTSQRPASNPVNMANSNRNAWKDFGIEHSLASVSSRALFQQIFSPSTPTMPPSPDPPTQVIQPSVFDDSIILLSDDSAPASHEPQVIDLTGSLTNSEANTPINVVNNAGDEGVNVDGDFEDNVAESGAETIRLTIRLAGDESTSRVSTHRRTGGSGHRRRRRSRLNGADEPGISASTSTDRPTSRNGNVDRPGSSGTNNNASSSAASNTNTTGSSGATSGSLGTNPFNSDPSRIVTIDLTEEDDGEEDSVIIDEVLSAPTLARLHTDAPVGNEPTPQASIDRVPAPSPFNDIDAAIDEMVANRFRDRGELLDNMINRLVEDLPHRRRRSRGPPTPVRPDPIFDDTFINMGYEPIRDRGTVPRISRRSRQTPAEPAQPQPLPSPQQLRILPTASQPSQATARMVRLGTPATPPAPPQRAVPMQRFPVQHQPVVHLPPPAMLGQVIHQQGPHLPGGMPMTQQGPHPPVVVQPHMPQRLHGMGMPIPHPNTFPHNPMIPMFTGFNPWNPFEHRNMPTAPLPAPVPMRSTAPSVAPPPVPPLAPNDDYALTKKRPGQRQGKICLKGRAVQRKKTQMTTTTSGSVGNKRKRGKQEEWRENVANLTFDDLQLEQEMYILIDDVIKTCVSIRPESAKFIMDKMNWDMSKIKEKFGSTLTEQTLMEPPIVQVAEFADFAHGACQICYEDTNLISTSCRHNLCTGCWSQYIRTKVKDENVWPIPCFGVDCKNIISDTVVYMALEQHKHTQRRYDKACLRNFKEKNPNVRHCPNPRCDRVFQAPRSQTEKPDCYECDCGMSICRDCKHEFHWPISCYLLGLFDETEDEQNLRWLNKNAKKCPQCRAPIEKNGGCPHMVCKKCTHQFCWSCLGPWLQHNNINGSCLRAEDKRRNTKPKDVEHQPTTKKRVTAIQAFITEWESTLSNFSADAPVYIKDAIQSTLRNIKYLKYSYILYFFTAPDTLHSQLCDLLHEAHLEVRSMVSQLEVHLEANIPIQTKHFINSKNKLTEVFEALKKVADGQYVKFNFVEDALIYDD